MQQMITRNEKHISVFLKVFIAVLILSGLCYFSLPFLSKKILSFIDAFGIRGELYSFAMKLIQAANYNEAHYPFMGYSTDLLGFAHLTFALLFGGAVMDPNKNEWVIRFGLMVCVLLIPTVLLAGWVREIPIIWRVVNCFFGVFGFALLFKVFKMVKSNQELRKAIEELNQKKITPEIRVA